MIINTRDLKIDEYQSNLYVVLKQLLPFYKFYDYFCRRNSLMNRPCHNNLFQFSKLGMVILTYWKCLKPRVNTFWYCFSVIKGYSFHYLMKSALIPGNQRSFEILLLIDIWSHKSLVILFFSSVVILI